MAQEAVRLVIWDLDETFWQGTLTEGGIKYLDQHHSIVVELARRGIMSSICSKNDLEPVKKILSDQGLWDYFIFPSIAWDTKGPRLAAMIDTIGLRPPTVLFVDDNPMNLREAEHFVPGLQVADETIIGRLLADPRLKGKSDPGLTRLAQYKLLEKRNQDMVAKGDNVAFLRTSGIQVTIEHDINANIDRAVELINRTNQLNFTKKRLPEDTAAARQQLSELLARANIQAGLVRVRDNYGAYGLVGFYVLDVIADHLIHYCFSCRTLGMQVEAWLYDRMGKPGIVVQGEVLTDLSAPRAPIDWIAVAGETTAASETPRIDRRIFVRGGCDMMAVCHFLNLNLSGVTGEFNIARYGKQIRLDHSAFLRYALDGITQDAVAAGKTIGFLPEDFSSELAKPDADVSVCLFSFWTDAIFSIYTHTESGLRVPFGVEGYDNAQDVTKLDPAQQRALAGNVQVFEHIQALKANFVYQPPGRNVFWHDLHKIMSHLPKTTDVFFLLACDALPPDRGGFAVPYFAEINQVIREVVTGRPNTHLLSVMDFVKDPGDFIDPTHFGRLVYFRIYQEILRILMEPKEYDFVYDILMDS